MDIKDCLERGYLALETPATDLIEKEIKESEYDLARAESALKDKDGKWAIIKSYYSMFHAAKAVCFKAGYREKKHLAILILLEELNKKGKLENKFVNYFTAAIQAREGADYHYNYSLDKAASLLHLAKEFNLGMKLLIKDVVPILF